MFVVDENSNFVCFNWKGEKVWEKMVTGYPTEAPVIGDIDGDGLLDIVVATNEGHIWAFQAGTGTLLPNYPIKLKGRVMSQILLVDTEVVVGDAGGKGMSLVVHSSDGHMYIIEGPSGCSDKVDIGEPSFSMVLADDLTSNGFLDLLVTTKSGNIYCLGTSIPFHPSKAWLTPNQNRNGYTAGKHRGIYVLEQSRQFRDITGSHFFVAFEIVDKGYQPRKSHYTVNIKYGSKVLLSTRYESVGIKQEKIEVPQVRAQVTVTVELVNELGLASFDSFGVSF